MWARCNRLLLLLLLPLLLLLTTVATATLVRIFTHGAQIDFIKWSTFKGILECSIEQVVGGACSLLS
jgi:hypothetical protein